MADEFPAGLVDFVAGSQIASYQVAEEIGRGGMAVVYRAHDVRLDRWVALKVLAPEFAQDDAFRQRFIRESRAAAAVDHPNIIPIFDAGEARGVLFIAMRYVRGQDVHSLVHRTGPLPPRAGRQRDQPGGVGAGRRARAGPGAPRREAGQHAARPARPRAARLITSTCLTSASASRRRPLPI